MSEEIIIDGVDVSECGFLDISPVPDLFLCGESENDFGILECKEYSDCYYKQLKKCEQKLEKIKEICKEAIRLCDCLDADANYDCIDCTEGGRASLAKEITRVLKDER